MAARRLQFVVASVLALGLCEGAQRSGSSQFVSSFTAQLQRLGDVRAPSRLLPQHARKPRTRAPCWRELVWAVPAEHIARAGCPASRAIARRVQVLMRPFRATLHTVTQSATHIRTCAGAALHTRLPWASQQRQRPDAGQVARHCG